MGSVRCSRALVPSRSVHRPSVLRLHRLPRRLLLLLVAPRRLLLRPVAPRIVHTASASPSRPRPTELHQSTLPSLDVVATSWTKPREDHCNYRDLVVVRLVVANGCSDRYLSAVVLA